MLIDDFLPDYDARERHRTKVHAPIDRVYAEIRHLNLSPAKLSMFLFRLRGISASSCFTLEDCLKMGFVLLGEKANEELLLGLVGRFWMPTGQLRRLDVEGYRNFKEPGYAKAAWNFSLYERRDGSVSLETETRVYCTDNASRRWFRLYWFFIGAFSGLIRREILQAIRQSAEVLPSRAA